MKQILQDLRTGHLQVADVPCPQPARGALLIRTRASLISAGTERMLVEFAKTSLVQKARQQPEKVRQVLDKIKADGLMLTLQTVFRKLDDPLPLGYSNAGTVIDVGEGVDDVRPGDRVASNGPHAEFVVVPRNLCAKIPEGVTDDEAAFTVLGSVALHGLRLAEPTLGERFMVFGTGLVGLLTVQLLQAAGCEVLAVDPDKARLKRAQSYGCQIVPPSEDADPVRAAQAWTSAEGVDGVMITATAKTNALVHQAALSCRKRGRIVLVGVVGLHLRRSIFYHKELTFRVACSYGPGRYDEQYEQAGRDYPRAYVRWTLRRNFEAVLGAIEAKRLQVDDLITDRFPLADAATAYNKICHDRRALGVILRYSPQASTAPAAITTPRAAAAAGKGVVGVIGAGNFAKGILLPALAKTSAAIAYVADLNPPAARHAAVKFGSARAVTDYRMILDDPRVEAVFVVVEHHLHARLVCEALQAGKHVFVEKPLAVSREELAQVAQAARQAKDRFVTVGFNRRFSRHTAKIRELLAGRREPLSMSLTVNAGFVPPDHWTQDPARGGGRIIGEACHFMDLLAYLSGSRVSEVYAMTVGPRAAFRGDKTSIVLGFEDGSVAAVSYFANGCRSYPKETLEVFSEGRVLKLENFRLTRGYGFKRFRKFKTWRQDKGHDAEIAAFMNRLSSGGPPLIPFEESQNATLASIAAVESAATGKAVALDRSTPIPRSNPHTRPIGGSFHHEPLAGQVSRTTPAV